MGRTPSSDDRAALEMVERHIARGKQILARQKQLIERLEREGLPVQAARDALHQFEETQRMHIRHKEWLTRDGE